MALQIVFSLLLSTSIFFVSYYLDPGKMGGTSNLIALMMVLGVTFSATLVSHPWKRLLWTAGVVRRAFTSRHEIDWTIDAIVTLVRAYRKNGIRALEQLAEKVPDGLLKTGVELIAYNYTKERIEEILKKEARKTLDQYETARAMLSSMAKLAPLSGLAGTLLLLTRVSGHLTDPQTLIGSIAVALLSTFYGILIAHLFFAPLSSQIKEFMGQEQIRLELIQDGILSLFGEENPRAIEFRLEAFSSATAFKSSPISSREKFFIVPPREQAPPASS
jgi:chemotaxis protein MotA